MRLIPQTRSGWHRLGAVVVSLCLCLGIALVSAQHEAGNRLSFEASTDVAGSETFVCLRDTYPGYDKTRLQYFHEVLWNINPDKRCRLECIDDDANYANRLLAMDNDAGVLQELELTQAPAVMFMTMDGYTLESIRLTNPGSIIAVNSRSNGTDCMVMNKTKFASVDELHAVIKDGTLPQIGLLEGFTPNSHVLSAAMSDLEVLDDYSFTKPDQGWQRRFESPEETFAAFVKGSDQGGVDIAMLWDPYCTRAMRDHNGMGVVDTSTMDAVYDVWIASAKAQTHHRDFLTALMQANFKAVSHFSQDEQHEELVMWAIDQTGFSRDEVVAMYAGVKFYTLADNCLVLLDCDLPGEETQMGIRWPYERNAALFVEHGFVEKGDIPDLLTMVNNDFVQAAYLLGADVLTEMSTEQLLSMSVTHRSDWSGLEQLELQDQPFAFPEGSAELTEEVKGQVSAWVTKNLSGWAHVARIEWIGYTNTASNPEPGTAAWDEHVELSENRAQAIADFLMAEYDMDPDRLRVVGRGSADSWDCSAPEWQRMYRWCQSLMARVTPSVYIDRNLVN